MVNSIQILKIDYIKNKETISKALNQSFTLVNKFKVKVSDLGNISPFLSSYIVSILTYNDF